MPDITITTPHGTPAELLEWVAGIARKADAYDALVGELTESARHLAKRSVTYANESDKVRGDLAIDIARREFASGKAKAYYVASDEISFVLERSARRDA